MFKQLKIVLLTFSLMLGTVAASAQEAAMPPPAFVYVGLEPEIVTNFATTNDGRLGYVRVQVEVVLEDPAYMSFIDQHMPLLRSTVIEIFGQSSGDIVRSLTGREKIRRTIRRRFDELMLRETGETFINDVIFTKYIRQG